jgi:hypothetical protein
MHGPLGGIQHPEPMILRTHVVPPPTFRPDHQVGRVLAYVDGQLQHRNESKACTGAQLVFEASRAHGGISGRRVEGASRTMPTQPTRWLHD